jgi:UDP-N-acetyl-D-mannosaminuronic acid dehydrogenase
VLTTDPFVSPAIDPDLKPLDAVIAGSDLLILCAPHAVYKTTDFKGRPVYDLWGHVEAPGAIR